MNWYKTSQIEKIAADIGAVAAQIQQMSEQINTEKNNYYKEMQKNRYNPQVSNQVSTTVNRCWQSVVSAVRSLKAQNIVAAEGAISEAQKILGQICSQGVVNCAQGALANISNMLTQCYQGIESLTM